MSVVIALKDGNKFVIGVDARITFKNYYDDEIDHPVKMRILENGIVLGLCGTLGLSEWFVNKLEKLEELNIDTLRDNVIFPLLTHSADHRLFLDECEVIVAQKDKAFFVLDNGHIEEIYNIYVNGSGYSVAKSYLISELCSGKDSEHKIKQAIKLCASVNNTVSSKGFITDTNTLKVKRFD